LNWILVKSEIKLSTSISELRLNLGFKRQRTPWRTAKLNKTRQNLQNFSQSLRNLQPSHNSTISSISPTITFRSPFDIPIISQTFKTQLSFHIIIRMIRNDEERTQKNCLVHRQNRRQTSWRVEKRRCGNETNDTRRGESVESIAPSLPIASTQVRCIATP
jgi:hypothetical protein